MRCVTITLNAAVDTTYRLDHFAHGTVNRVSRKIMVPGGKGNNVAKVLSTLGTALLPVDLSPAHQERLSSNGSKQCRILQRHLSVLLANREHA